jgi:hypothetical protein
MGKVYKGLIVMEDALKNPIRHIGTAERGIL